MMLLPLFQKAADITKQVFRGVYVNLVAAAIIVLVGFIIGKLLGKLASRLLRELDVLRVLKEAGVHAPIDRYAGRAVSYLCYFVAIAMALHQLRIATVIVYLIVAAVLLMMVLSFGLSIKDFVPNMMAGLAIYRDSRIRKGEHLETQGVKGEVIAVSLTKIKLRTGEGNIAYLPNAALIRHGFVKRSNKGIVTSNEGTARKVARKAKKTAHGKTKRQKA